MTMADADGGGQKQLLVGSDDFEVIRTQERPSSVGGSMHGPTGIKAPILCATSEDLPPVLTPPDMFFDARLPRTCSTLTQSHSEPKITCWP